MYRVEYTQKANEDLKKLSAPIVRRILKKIEFYASEQNPLAFAKPLHGQLVGTYRFRIGDFRAIFWVDQSGYITILNILRIKHRKDIYDL